MSTLFATNVAKLIAGGQGDNVILASEVNTRELIWSDNYTFSSAPANSTLDIADVPQGAQIQSIIVYHAALGGSTTLAIGDSNDADRYSNAAASTSAGQRNISNIGGFLYKIGTNTGDNRIRLTLAGGTGNGQIKALVTYTI